MQTRKRLSFLGIGTLAAVLAGAFGLIPFVQTIELLMIPAGSRSGQPAGLPWPSTSATALERVERVR